MQNKSSIQIQSVLYHNEPGALIQALDNLSNAVRVDRETDQVLSEVKVCYGDASRQPLFTEAEVQELQKRYGEYLTLDYQFRNENTGTSKGHNLMGESCVSDYMMIMNPDVLINPHFFKQMLTPFLEGTDVGMTEARQTPVEHHKEYDAATGETSWATTAAAAFPTSIFRQLDGFDAETFFMYCDDLDFSWRVRLNGYKVIYVPQAVVFHSKHLSAAGAWQPTKAEQYYSAEAALMMAHKWSNPKMEKKLLSIFLSDEDAEKKRAAENFRKRREQKTLPTPIDPEHRVAEFVGYGYGKSRFQMK